MVTTRGGTETPGAPTPTPRSSTRKQVGKRELESLETPTQTKRQRKAPKATAKKGNAKNEKETSETTDEPSQESSNDTSDTVAGAALTLGTPETPRQSGLPARQKSSPQVVISNEASDESSNTMGKEDEVPSTVQNPAFYTPTQAPGSVYATPATHKQPEGSPTPKAKKMTEQTPSAAVKKGRGRPKKTPQKELVEITDEVPSSTFESEMAPIPSQDSIPPSVQPEKTHMRFGSEEPALTQESPIVNKQGSKHEAAEPVNEAPQADDEKDDEASDSDDEAPEVVTTAAASSKALAARAEAERAQKAQQAKEEAKRKAREEFLAAQQAAKREREEKKAKKLAKQAAKEAKAAAAAAGGLDADEDPASESRMDLDTSNGLLPASLLETIDDQRPPTPPPERRGKTEEERRKEKLNQHIKFLERTDKPAKDVKKGKLSVAVLAQQNKVMQPKMNRNTKNVREDWLKGRQAEKKKQGPRSRLGKMERRPHVSRGFLRDGDD